MFCFIFDVDLVVDIGRDPDVLFTHTYIIHTEDAGKPLIPNPNETKC